MACMIGIPQPDEAASYYFRYIDLVSDGNILQVLRTQMEEALSLFSGISEEKSLHRYQPEKWSIRELLGHINDAERVFTYRALTFARGDAGPLPGFDQDPWVSSAHADSYTWASHVEDFQAVRLATLTMLRNVSPEVWMRRGVASDNPFTVRALGFIVAGHAAHHLSVMKDKYL
jgi:hypothetical protein